MPGKLTSSSLITVARHTTATDFLSATHSHLQDKEQSSNIVFAHALKRLRKEAGSSLETPRDVEEWLRFPRNRVPDDPNAFWLTVWTVDPTNNTATLDLILSCVDWTLGNYPIFLWSPQPEDKTWLIPRITKLTNHLLECVPSERVFSVFGMTSLVKSFSEYWTALTGHEVEPEPFYAALLSHCTEATFVDSSSQLPTGHVIRLATKSDVKSVAQLCKEFGDDSVYFPMTLDQGRIEAQELIKNAQAWIYDVDGQCSTICTVTRTTHKVSCITKVYTTPKFRRMGCAEHLVRHVTRGLLFDANRDAVTLYVSHGNSAQRVYDRVGFVGLCGKERPAGVEDAIEFGFVGTARGHW
ncbi:hypothetical protein BDM02DRAFT_3092896 [Thelephora ganbajun]|uniref:Uncharacterized protein n=1 Tax=Thelephora ganbajun TaxID=370292 RepID=A0ACB6ZLU9_THEGA|nr:hypothetical protein BDM02DRAFT_3092896 [Thelephora ganbajun]